MKALSIYAIAVFAAGATLATGCSSDESGGDEVAGDLVSFTSNLRNGNEEPGTRVTGQNWDRGDCISVGIRNSASGVIEKFGVYTTLSKSAQADFSPVSGEDRLYFPQVPGESASFVATYPAEADNPEEIVDLTEQDNLADVDILRAVADNGGVGYTKEWAWQIPGSIQKVPLVFNHELAKFRLNIHYGGGVASGANVSQTNIGPIVDKVRYDRAKENPITVVRTGEAGNEVESKALITLKPVSAVPGAVATYDLIVAPFLYTESPVVTVTLDNADVYVWRLPANTHFKAGYMYTYDLTLKQAGIEVEGSVVSDWKMDGNVYFDEAF